MGIGTLGFLKGASSQMLSSLEARDKAELEVKKQDKLDQLREDRIQQREMKEAVTFQTEKTPTGYDRVGYNKQGGEVIRRAANAPEVDAQKQSEEDRGWILKERDMKEKDFKGDESERAQRMRLAAASDARAARSSTAGAGAGGSADGSDPDDPDAINFDRAKELRYRYSDEITNAVRKGKISQEAVTAASIALAREARSGSEMQQKFLEFLNRYRTTGRTLDTTDSNSTWKKQP